MEQDLLDLPDCSADLTYSVRDHVPWRAGLEDCEPSHQRGICVDLDKNTEPKYGVKGSKTTDGCCLRFV